MTLEPKFLGPHLNDLLKVHLYRQVEGTCSGRHGYIVAIVSVDDIGSGMVHDSYGFVSFDVKYTAIVLKPFKNEVFDAVVESVNKASFWVNRQFLMCLDGILCKCRTSSSLCLQSCTFPSSENL